MPVAIACPKCQTRYSLPDQALGKPVKCKSCGAVFKTRSPQPKGVEKAATKSKASQPASRPQQQPAQRTTQTSNAELAKYGIDGPIGKPADIFAGAGAPPPQMGNPLGNFVLEDPGFADLNVVQESVQEEMHQDDGMAAIVKNPYLTPAKTGSKARKKAAVVDVSGYGVARVGMWMVYVAWGITLGISVFFALIGAFFRLLPQETLTSIVESVGPTPFQILGWIMLTFVWVGVISSMVIFLGQILCIFAPNKDEKLFAGLTVGSIFGAFALLVVIFFMGVLGSVVGNQQQTTQAVLGIFVLLAFFGIYALLLASMFFYMTYFKRIGKNVKSKKVMESAKTAMLTWVSAIAIGIISSVATGIVVGFFASQDETFARRVVDIVGIVNLFLVIAVMGTLLVMVRSAIDATKPA